MHRASRPRSGRSKVRILSRSRHSENHARKSMVFCFCKKPKRKFKVLEKTMNLGDSPWFSICTVDKKGTPKVILSRSRINRQKLKRSKLKNIACFCFLGKWSFFCRSSTRSAQGKPKVIRTNNPDSYYKTPRLCNSVPTSSTPPRWTNTTLAIPENLWKYGYANTYRHTRALPQGPKTGPFFTASPLPQNLRPTQGR